jgi:hypothetical protein
MEINMPTIVFRVKLESDVRNSTIPAAKSSSAFESESALQKSTWFPNHLRNNRQLKDDATFTVQGYEAVYLRDLINTNQINFLEIVTTTL